MTEDKAILVINAIVNKENMADVKTYLGSIMPVFGKNGGKPIARYKTIEQLAGEESPEMIAIVEFPSAQKIKDMMRGDDFSSLAEIRSRAFTKLNIMICGAM
jgi:uncharacterized protein (DUF1330 family)